MKVYDIPVNGVSSFVAQVDSVMALSEWFESKEDRVFVLPFDVYCNYLSKHDRPRFSCSDFDSSYSLIQRLCSGDVNINISDAFKILDISYCSYLYDIGTMLLKSASLYSSDDIDWNPFDIVTSLPVALKEYFGYKEVSEYSDIDNDDINIIELSNIDNVNSLLQDNVYLTFMLNRRDFSVRDTLCARGTSLEFLVRKGITYLKMSNDRIKGRVGGEVIEHF